MSHHLTQRARLKAEEAKTTKWQNDTDRGILLIMAIICIPAIVVATVSIVFLGG